MRFGGLIIAILLAAAAAVIVLRTSSSGPSAPLTAPIPGASAPLKGVNIYVAAKQIPAGAKITQEMVAVQPWPENQMLEGFVRADNGTATVVGSIARGTFQAQEPILASKIAGVNDANFLAGDLPKGMRVITIATNEIEGVAGFVFPGDHVDILLTHDVGKGASPFPGGAKQDAVTETLLNNVKVVAVDQRSSSAGALDKDGKLIVPRSVSLMVSPGDAQRLRLGAKEGTLTMMLRGVDDREGSDPMTITSISDISQYHEGAADTGGGVLVLRGAPGDKSSTNKLPSPPAP